MGQRSDFEILRDLDRALDKLPEDTDPNDLIEKAKQEEQEEKMGDAKDKDIRTQVGSRIDKQLWQQVKARAALEGRKAGYVLDDAIRMYLKTEQQDREKEKT